MVSTPLWSPPNWYAPVAVVVTARLASVASVIETAAPATGPPPRVTVRDRVKPVGGGGVGATAAEPPHPTAATHASTIRLRLIRQPPGARCRARLRTGRA